MTLESELLMLTIRIVLLQSEPQKGLQLNLNEFWTINGTFTNNPGNMSAKEMVEFGRNSIVFSTTDLVDEVLNSKETTFTLTSIFLHYFHYFYALSSQCY